VSPGKRVLRSPLWRHCRGFEAGHSGFRNRDGRRRDDPRRLGHRNFWLWHREKDLDTEGACSYDGFAGWSSPVARWAHNPKVAGSNPAPATMQEEWVTRFSRNPFLVGDA
jgi:hypothetical protein